MHTSHAAWVRPVRSATELAGAHGEAGLVTGRSLRPSTDWLLCPDIQGQGGHPPGPSAVISQMCVRSGSRGLGRRVWRLLRTSSPRAIVLAARDASCPWSPPRTLQADSQVPWNLTRGPRQAPRAPHVSPVSSSAEGLAGQGLGLGAKKNKKLMSQRLRQCPVENRP